LDSHSFRLAPPWLAVVVAILSIPALASSNPWLVQEINTSGASSDPTLRIESGGNVFFIATMDESDRQALWKTDGTLAGTIELAPFAPHGFHPDDPYLTDIDGTVYFLNAISGDMELWRSDGTPGGTGRVATLPPTFEREIV
jgi:ELWxxDGT repeat protein